MSDPVRSAFHRHDARRKRGVATVTVLVGPPAEAHGAWSEWAAVAHRPTIVTSGPDPVGAWWVEILAAEEVLSGVWQRMAEAFQSDALTLRARFAQQTEHERGLFWEALTARDTSTLPALARQIVEERSPTLSTETLETLDRAAGPLPALFWTGPGLATAVVLRLCAWAQRVPSLALCVGLSDEAYQRFLHEASEMRERALALEGVVHLTQFDEHVPSFEAQLAEATILCSRASDSREANGKARNAAERLLFAALEAQTATRGAFKLNEDADFLLANRPVEVDILATERRIAIEVDGYFHFISRDDYRRDRRKDLALQEHGYLVLRFLAEDVPARLEEILGTIEAALTARVTAISG